MNKDEEIAELKRKLGLEIMINQNKEKTILAQIKTIAILDKLLEGYGVTPPPPPPQKAGKNRCITVPFKQHLNSVTARSHE